ncbi:Periplasmic copper binding protein (NosD) Right handed beta helix region [Trypanosoma vivax]|nr:hypothetical protein TRVL_03402 [Trypanosoma vivax]KAH8619050.1 Periplasmic copper binding protein (NosD) Right handed beta helix region [Trypanosoma vivax]
MPEDSYLIEERYSLWQKRKVRTIVVNSRSRSTSKRNVSGALAIVKPYERIELVGGEYFETLSINVPVEITAAEGEDPVIVSRSCCVTVTHDVKVYFEGVEFISKGKSRLESSVVLMHGVCTFSRCKMNSVIIGGYAKTQMENCTIAESYNGYGMQINDSGSADILRTSIHTHRCVCALIDTKGTVMMRENQFLQPSNVGNVIVVQAVHSAVDDNTPEEFLACRCVTFKKCNISLTQDIYRPKDREWVRVESTTLPPCCVLISRGAAPVFSHNELTQGIIGFAFDSAGRAVLEGNSISRQRKCGVLAIIDDSNYVSGGKQRSLSFSGDNRIDRCFIGFDVHCAGKTALSVSGPDQVILPQDLPPFRSAFDWLQIVERKKTTVVHLEPSSGSCSVKIDGHTMSEKRLTSNLSNLARSVCANFPQYFKRSVTTGLMKANMNAANASDNLGDLIQEMFNISLHPSDIAGAGPRLTELRRQRGIEIVGATFSSCELCAIRFVGGSYGLVEDCCFSSCGATSILVGCASHPLIVGCTFQCSKGVGIFLDNFANPLIIGNKIACSAEHGIEARNMARGVVIGNSISENSLCGVCIDTGASSIIAANSIRTNAKGGVSVAGGSKPFLVANRITGNAPVQVSVMGSSMPFVASNLIVNGRGIGIHFGSCTGGTVVDNTIAQNGRGIVVELDGDPLVLSNKVTNCQCGIVVENNGLGTFVENFVAHSSACNVLIKEGSIPVMRKNKIKGGAAGGLVVVAEGFGVMEYNDISENSSANVVVSGRYSDPVFTHNSITNSFSGGGVVCARDSSAKFVRNVISQNKQYGMCIIDNAAPLVADNMVSQEKNGIVISNGGRGVIRGNNVNSCYTAGIVIQSNGEPLVEKNKIVNCTVSGLMATGEARGRVSHNIFTENDVGMQLGSTIGPVVLDVDASCHSGNDDEESSKKQKSKVLRPRRVFMPKRDEETSVETPAASTLFSNNEIYANITCGILLESGSSGVVENNEIHSNQLYGIMADLGYSSKRVQEMAGNKETFHSFKMPQLKGGSSSTVIKHNLVHHNSRCNVALVDYASNEVHFSSNDVYEAPIGVYVANNATLECIDGNTIRNCEDGVFVESGGQGTFKNNMICNCSNTGVYVFDRGNPQFLSGNVIEKCRVSGVFVDAAGRGLFSNSIIRHCAVGAVVYTCPALAHTVEQREFVHNDFVSSAPVFEQCTIERNALHGVLLLSVAGGFPLRQKTADPLGVYQRVEGLVKLPKMPSFPFFKGNTISNNRHFGICHESYTVEFVTESLELSKSDGPSSRTTQTRKDCRSSLSNSIYMVNRSSVHSHLPSIPYPAAREAPHPGVGPESEKHIQERMQRQATFVENTVTRCSIGVVVGSGCHPFLFATRVYKNDFFGMLLRHSAQAICSRCELSDNGIAGLYAAPCSFGSFGFGVMRSNNGFCRSGKELDSDRDFRNLSFMQHIEELPASCKDGNKPCGSAFTEIEHTLKTYGDVAASGLRMLCEVLCASASCLSLARATVPCEETSSSGLFLNRALTGDCDRGWAADGGLGAWLAVGSMTEVTDNVIENNRNVGVYCSRSIQQQYTNLRSFIVEPIDGFPCVPGGNVIAGELQIPSDERNRWLLFSSSAMSFPNSDLYSDTFIASRSADDMILQASIPSKISNCSSKSHEGTPSDNDFLLMLLHPLGIRSNTITRNGFGVLVQLNHVMDAQTLPDEPSPDQSEVLTPLHGEKRRSERRRAAETKRKKKLSPTASDGAKRKHVTVIKTEKDADAVEGDEAASPSEDSVLPLWLRDKTDPKFVVNVEDNKVFENGLVGILCQHIVEITCGSYVESRFDLEHAVFKCSEAFCKIILGGEAPKPRLLFTLVANAKQTRNAKVSKNEIYHNPEQVQVVSRYVAITNSGDRVLLNIDTLRHPKASKSSSRALLTIPLFASLMQTTPQGCFYIDQNRIHDCARGIYMLGLLGERSTRVRRNTFTNIGNVAIHIEGHLSSATIGSGNVFEKNDVSLLISVPEEAVAEEEKARQRSMGVVTRVYGNTFVSSKVLSINVRGGGAYSPMVLGNKFTGHEQGSIAYYLCGSSTTAQLKGNVFYGNYLPVVITDGAGRGERNNLVVLEENIFLNNYIGLLICNGAAPRLTRNIFENNVRSGLEIVGKNTRPLVEHCFFLHGDDCDSPTLSRAVFSYPENGKLLVDEKLSLTVTLAPPNVVEDGDSTMTLSAGMVLKTESSPMIHHCFFKGNQIGVDVVRGSRDISGEESAADHGTLTHNAQLQSCLFTGNVVAGVWVRGWDSCQQEKGDAEVTTGKKEWCSRETLFLQCFFWRNTCTLDGCGDVVVINNGFALFRDNLFAGCVHGKEDGVALFEHNTFIYEGAIDTSICLHRSTRVEFVGNTIRGHKRGVVTFPGAWGRIEKCWIVEAMRGVFSAPYSNTLFVGNSVLGASECGVFAHGGVFSNNKIMGCATGVIVREPSDYKNHDLIPKYSRTSFDVLFSENHVHSCEAVGISISGASRIEGNVICNNKVNVNSVLPSNSSGRMGAAHLIKNAIFDGGVGVMLLNGSDCAVQGNDIFDNSLAGLWTKKGAGGKMQSNAVSSPLKEGALIVEEGSKTKVLSNLIRNQFSPSYRKTLAPQRERDRMQAADELWRELRVIGIGIVELGKQCRHIEERMLTTLTALGQNHSSYYETDLFGKLLPVDVIHKGGKNQCCSYEILKLPCMDVGKLFKLAHPCTIGVGVPRVSDATLKSTDRSVSSTQAGFAVDAECLHVLIHVLHNGSSMDEVTGVSSALQAFFAASPLSLSTAVRTSVTVDTATFSVSLTTCQYNIIVIVGLGEGWDTHPGEEAGTLQDVSRLVSELSGRRRSDNTHRCVVPLLRQQWKGALDELAARKNDIHSNLQVTKFFSHHVPLYFMETISETFHELTQRLDEWHSGQTTSVTVRQPVNSVSGTETAGETPNNKKQEWDVLSRTYPGRRRKKSIPAEPSRQTAALATLSKTTNFRRISGNAEKIKPLLEPLLRQTVERVSGATKTVTRLPKL